MGELGWQYGTGLKSHGTVAEWCTGKEWPVNSMTVISAWWRSNMPLQRQRKWHILIASYGEILSGWLNYYITRWRQEVSQFWRPDWLMTRCSRESQHTAERHNADSHKIGVQYVAVLFGLQLALTHNLSNKVRGCRSSLLCHCYDFACICVCWDGHGCDYTTLLVPLNIHGSS